MKTLGTLALVLLTAASAQAANYDIDNGHSQAVFSIKHMGVSNFYGVFHHVTGAVSWDKASPERASIEIAVRADSVFTADKKRDGHIKSPDFMSAKEFETLNFKSTAVKERKDGNFDVTGNLTFRGVTKSVTAVVTAVGEGKDPWGGYRAGFEARLSLKRSDYGSKAMFSAVSDNINLIIAVEAIQKK